MNPAQAAVNNTKLSEETVNDNGKSVAYIRATFMVDGHGPFTLRFPKEGFDGTAANSAIKQFAQRIHAACV